ncbi:RibD family protein [Larsenimonas rhizosphaerae]|uniref:RibD family protein n=1 Tax=Larsenimonas rhizosphaerae TaxID=2944682 RepID=A0AA41ZEC5_9GAMM|nr:RibD family protein [Larsenimonas rhizosphaerae]MCM2130316.1 RibD family protein [Larsenimonas rhizosphaerae]MCX2523021.1 RibD family protein [Larsenimonas rhizosphaerae]
MTQQIIDGDAWQVILAVRDRDNTACQRSEIRFDEGVIRLQRDGAWSSDTLLPAQTVRLFDLYLPLAMAGPMVIGQLGQSLDGRIATVTGASRYVTGQEGLVHLHRLRALVDAVIVGAGTASADDPRLTVRLVAGRHPCRVVLDPRHRVDSNLALFTDNAAPTLHLVNEPASEPPSPHVDYLDISQCQASDGSRPEQILALLAARGLSRVLVEGGGLTVSRFLEAGCLDRLHVMVAPMLIGSGRPAFTLPDIEELDQALRPECRTWTMGSDVLFDCRFPGSV